MPSAVILVPNFDLEYTTNVSVIVSGASTFVDLPTSTSLYWVASSVKSWFNPSTNATELSVVPPENFSANYYYRGTGKDFHELGILSGVNWPVATGYLELYKVGNVIVDRIYGETPKIVLYNSASSQFARAYCRDGSTLYGTVTDFYSNVYTINGTLDINTGYYSIDYSNLPASGYRSPDDLIIPVTGSRIQSKYDVLGDSVAWNVPVVALTGGTIEIIRTSLDQDIILSAVPLPSVNYYNVSSYFSPKMLQIVEDTNLTFITSAVVYPQIRANTVDQTKTLSAISYASEVRWDVSAPLSAYDGANNLHYITNSITIPLDDSLQMTFLSKNVNSQQYSISCTLMGGEGEDLIIHTPVYQFNYDPYVSDDLFIDVLSATDSRVWLKLNRYVYGLSNIYNDVYSIPQYGKRIKWRIDPSNIAGTFAVSGLTGLNITFPYDSAQISNGIPISSYGGVYTFNTAGSAGVVGTTAIDTFNERNKIGIDILEINTDPTQSITYSISGMYEDGSIYDVYSFVPNFQTKAILLSALYIENQQLVKQYQVTMRNEYAPGKYSSVDENNTIYWYVSGDTNYSNIKYTNGISYTPGTQITPEFGSTLNFYFSSESSSTPQLCSFNIIGYCLTSIGNDPLSAVYNVIFYEYPGQAPTFIINHEDPIIVNNTMYRLTNPSSYTVTAYDTTNTPTTSYSRIWDWGDGSTNTVTTSSTTHSYNRVSPDIYTINFAVSNVQYQSLSSTTTVITVSTQPGATIIHSPCAFNCYNIQLSDNGQYALIHASKSPEEYKIYKSSDYMSTWITLSTSHIFGTGYAGPNNTVVSRTGQTQSCIIRPSSSNSNSHIVVSNDYGTTWVETTSNIWPDYFTNISMSNNGQYLVANSFGSSVPPKISNDYGLTWSNIPLLGSMWCPFHTAISDDGQHITIPSLSGLSDGIPSLSGFYGIVYYSNDYGSNWSYVDTATKFGLSPSIIYPITSKMSSNGQYQYIHVRDIDNLTTLICRSSDYGSTWFTPVTGVIPVETFSRPFDGGLDCTDDGRILVACHSTLLVPNTLKCSFDYGSTWSSLLTTTEIQYTYCFINSSADIFAVAILDQSVYGYPYGDLMYAFTSINNILTGSVTTTTTTSSYVLCSYNFAWAQESDEYMDLVFIDRFLSGNFIAYPSLVFHTSSTEDSIILDQGNFTSSQGVCAYGEGHSETFNLSAGEDSVVMFGSTPYSTTYRWRIGDSIVYGKNATITVSSDIVTIDEIGTSIALDVFNPLLSMSTMVSSHTADNGSIEIYPNFGLGANTYGYTTDNTSNNLFQNIRMLRYENPTASLDINNEVLVVPSDPTISIDADILWPSYSPVTLDNNSANSFVWLLSSQKWSSPKYLNTSAPSITYTVSIGNGITPGTIKKNELTTIRVGISGDTYGLIEYPPNDWQSDYRLLATTFSDTYVTAFAEPDLLVSTSRYITLTGENVRFINETAQTPFGLVSAFMWDNNNGTVSAIYGFDDFNCIYNTAGSFNLNLTAVLFDGTVLTKQFDYIMTVINSYEVFDPEIFRVYGESQLQLTYTYEDIEIPPNEWCVADTINASFNKLNDNLTYIKSATKMYMPPPRKYYGWMGSGTEYGDISFKWHTIYNDLTAATDFASITSDSNNFTALNGIVYKDNLLYIANGTKLQILSGDLYGTLIDEREIKAIGDYFVDLKAVALDSTDRIYVLDSLKNRVVAFRYDASATDKWKLLYSWGGFGGSVAKNKFNKPSDLYIDSDDNIWVTDTNNLCIKCYTGAGTWKSTIESEWFTATNKPVSVTVDNDGNLCVLTSNYVVKMTKEGSYISKFTYNKTNSSIPKKIITDIDGGFIYLCLSDRVVKVTYDGILAGIIAEETGLTSNTSIYKNANRDLFITGSTYILRYNDRIQTLDSKIDTTRYEWDISDILIEGNEYVQDSVYNRSISRMWDNIEIIRRSILGKISQLNIDDQDSLIITGYTPEEYSVSSDIINKNNIYIGVNELVTSHVVNRCLRKLYDIQVKIFNLLV